MSQIQQVFIVDGQQFATKALADQFVQRPKIVAALTEITNDETLAVFLYDNRELVSEALDTGAIRRVTKRQETLLKDALAAVAEIGEGNKRLAFLIENADAIHGSFRWPTVKRLKPEEKVAKAKEALNKFITDVELVEWIAERGEQIAEAYKAGVEKRPINDNARAGLAKYLADQKRAKMLEAGFNPDDPASEAAYEEYRQNLKKK